MKNGLKKKGSLKKLWGMHGKFTKALSVGGLLLTTAILPFMAVDAKAIDPDAGLLDIGAHFYKFAISTAIECFAPGWNILLGETFNAAADITTSLIPSNINAAPSLTS